MKTNKVRRAEGGVRKETPLLMCGEMVRATLREEKDQTRRVVKFQEYGCLTGDCPHVKQAECDRALAEICPYGKPGDLIWVREAWGWESDTHDRVQYRADKPQAKTYEEWESGGDMWMHNAKWRPSIHLQKVFARIWLEIVSVRVERVQRITWEDCLAEGVRLPVDAAGKRFERLTGKFRPFDYLPLYKGATDQPLDSRTTQEWLVAHYASLWDSINVKKYPWRDNPWVWVIGFRRISNDKLQILKGSQRAVEGEAPVDGKPQRGLPHQKPVMADRGPG